MPLEGGGYTLRDGRVKGKGAEHSAGGHTTPVRCAFSGGCRWLRSGIPATGRPLAVGAAAVVEVVGPPRQPRWRARRRRVGKISRQTEMPAPEASGGRTSGSSQSQPAPHAGSLWRACPQSLPAAASGHRSRGTPECRSKMCGGASLPTRNGAAARSPEADARSRPPMRRRRGRDQSWARHQPQRLTRPPVGPQSLQRRPVSARLRARLRHARPFRRPARHGSSRAARRLRVMRSARLCGAPRPARGDCCVSVGGTRYIVRWTTQHNPVSFLGAGNGPGP